MSTQKFEEKYRRYKDLIFRIAFTYVKNREDAEDILQDTLIRYMQSSPDFNGPEHEKAWLLSPGLLQSPQAFWLCASPWLGEVWGLIRRMGGP